MIYIMHELESGLYKIGSSRDKRMALRVRLPALRGQRSREAGEKRTIKLIAWLNWPRSAEAKLQRWCWKLSAGGEWFRDGPALRQVFEWARTDDFFGMEKAISAAGSSLPATWDARSRQTFMRRYLWGAKMGLKWDQTIDDWVDDPDSATLI